MAIVHVGLGKTATTTLQKHVFPKIAERNDYIFNDTRLRGLALKSTRFSLSKQEIAEFHEILSSADHLLSLESLVNWNPAHWEGAATRNLHLFGESAIILITVREPLSWMTSVYQQKIHEGNIIRPNHFFLPEEKYCYAEQISNSSKLEYFCPDYVDYDWLREIYASRFHTVKVVDTSQLAYMEFLDEIFGTEECLKQNLINSFHSAPRENRAYSASAMALTLRREKLLRMFGVKSIGSSDRRLEDFDRMWSAKERPKAVTFRSLKLEQKIAQLPFRLLRRLFKLPKWRTFVQKGYDKLIPYKKYELPSDVYLNWEKIEKSRIFIRSLKIDDS